MIGITSCGGYVPYYRLDRKKIFKAVGWINSATAAQARGEKAVSNCDEDIITMAVAAARNCLKTFKSDNLGGAYLASTTFPYNERLNAGILSTALNLSPKNRSADFASSLRSGTTAVLTALDSIASGNQENLLVCASDCRLGKVGSPQEHIFGDGAAAFVIGKKNVAAKFIDSISLTYDFVDRWRSSEDKFDRIWEERFVKEAGYGEIIPKAVSHFFSKTGMKPDQISKFVFACPFPREHASISKKLGFNPETQLQNNLVTSIGDTGAAFPLMMLAAALREAKPKDKILLASYGNGSDVICFEATEEISKIAGQQDFLSQKTAQLQYEKYLVFKNLVSQDVGIRGELENATAFSHLWRDQKAVQGLVGSKCTKCNTPQFPPQRVCVNPQCGATDEMEEYPFSNQKGTVFTYTGDMLAFSTNPPAVYGLVDMNGGGRLFTDFTDCEVNELDVEMPIEMSFRRKYHDTLRNIHGYCWKAVPVRE